MRTIAAAMAACALLTVGLTIAGTPTVAATSAPPEGTVLQHCQWSGAGGSCSFNAVKGADYLLRVLIEGDCASGNGKIELVNPLGQATVTVPSGADDCLASTLGYEFRAAYTATYQLRYTPSAGYPPDDPYAAGADVVTDCRVGAKTQCVIPFGGRPLASEHSANGDGDWFRLPNLRRGKLYTITATNVDLYTSLWVVDASGHILAKGQVHTDSTTGSVRFRPSASGTYFLDIPNGYHRTLSMR